MDPDYHIRTPEDQVHNGDSYFSTTEPSLGTTPRHKTSMFEDQDVDVASLSPSYMFSKVKYNGCGSNNSNIDPGIPDETVSPTGTSTGTHIPTLTPTRTRRTLIFQDNDIPNETKVPSPDNDGCITTAALNISHVTNSASSPKEPDASVATARLEKCPSNDTADTQAGSSEDDGEALSPKRSKILPENSTPTKPPPAPTNTRRPRHEFAYSPVPAKEGHVVVHLSKSCGKTSGAKHKTAGDMVGNVYATWLDDHLLNMATNVNIAEASSRKENGELDHIFVHPPPTPDLLDLPTPDIKNPGDLPQHCPPSPIQCVHNAIAKQCHKCNEITEKDSKEKTHRQSLFTKFEDVAEGPDREKPDEQGKTEDGGSWWYFPPWRYLKEMSAPPARVFDYPQDLVANDTMGSHEINNGVEPAHESKRNHTIEALRGADFIFQQGDIVCCGLSHNVSGFFGHVNNTLLSLVAYVSCPQKTANTGVRWPDTVTHAGFISFGGNVDKAEMAHNRSHGLKTWPLLEYLQQHSMPIWVIRSPVLATAPGQPHRVYNNVERSIFEAMLDRYSLHSAWMMSYLPPAESDKYNFSFLLNFLSLYSESFRREVEKAKKAAIERYKHEKEAAEKANNDAVHLGCSQTKIVGSANTATEEDIRWKKALGAEMGGPCSVWRHVLPFGELLAFPPLHALLGGEGAYCSLSVAQFFHDCLLVHCNVDKAIKQAPSLSPFYLGLEGPINNLIEGFDLRHDDGINFKILSPYIIDIIRRLVDAENDLGCTSAVTRLPSKSNAVDNTMLFGDAKCASLIAPNARAQGVAEQTVPVIRPVPPPPPSVTTIDEAKKSIKTRVQRIRAAVQEELMFNSLLRFDPQQVDEITKTVAIKEKEMLDQLDEDASDITVKPTLQTSLDDIIKSWVEDLDTRSHECIAHAAQVKKLSIETFQSLHLLMAKSKNAILNEWVHDLHRRSLKSPGMTSSHSRKSAYTSVSNYVSRTGNEAANTKEHITHKYSEEEEKEEKRQWEEDILYLCARYHTELKAKFEIEFLNFLLDCRVKIVPFLSGITALNTKVTIKKLRKLLSIIEPLVLQRLSLRKQEIELAIAAAKEKEKKIVAVQAKYETIPPILGSILVRQGLSPTSTRDSVLVDYLQVSAHSGLVLIDEEEAKFQKKKQGYRDDPISDDASVSTNTSPLNAAKDTNVSLYPPKASRNYSNISTTGQYTRSRDAYKGMFNAHAHLAQKQHDAAKMHYIEMYSGSKCNVPAEKIAVERRKRVHRANDAVSEPWVIVLTHLVVFYVSTVMYCYWTAHASPFIAPLNYISDISSRTTSFLTLLGILITSLLFVFQPTLQFCIILVLVWNRLMWKSFLRPMALGVVTMVVEMQHHLRVLCGSLRMVEITSLFSMVLIAAAVLANQNAQETPYLPTAFIISSTPSTPALITHAEASLDPPYVASLQSPSSAFQQNPVFSLVIWLVHCTCWALCIVSNNVPIYGRMVLDHFCLTLPIAYLLSWHFAINFLPTYNAILQILCFIAFVVYLPKDWITNDVTWWSSFFIALFRLGGKYKPGDEHFPFITVFHMDIWHKTLLSRFILYLIGRTTITSSAPIPPQPVIPEAVHTAHAGSSLSHPPNSPRMHTPLKYTRRSRAWNTPSAAKADKVSNATDTRQLIVALTPFKRKKSEGDDPLSESKQACSPAKTHTKVKKDRNHTTESVEETNSPVSSPDSASSVDDSGEGSRAAVKEENTGCKTAQATVTNPISDPSSSHRDAFDMSCSWILWIARDLVFPTLAYAYPQATRFAFVVLVGFQGLIALYYDALCTNRYSSISIFRAARDVRLSLDHDYKQGIVSGTIQPNKEEFSRSIMKDVKRYIMLPQWLRDYARREAVVYSSPSQM